jgi:hypothetical protein
LIYSLRHEPQLDYVNMGKPTTIYFDINDAKVFKEKVGQPLKEQKRKGFNPKNSMLNPDGRSTDHILMGLPQNKQKAGILC